MKARSASQLLDSIAGDNIPGDTNLLPRILTCFQDRRRAEIMRNRPIRRWMIVLFVLALSACVIFAAGRSFGYIPGIGMVEQSGGIRILREPVSATQNGVSVTVEKVVADSTRTSILYRIEGVYDPPRCTEPPALRLPDGSRLTFLGGGGGGMDSAGGGFETLYTFPPIPAQILSVTFLSPCQLPSIELTLIHASADYASPAIKRTAAFDSSGPPPPVASAYAPATIATPFPLKTGLYLDQVFELESAYILIGNFTDTGDLPGRLITENPLAATGIYFTDSSGGRVPFIPWYDIQPPAESANVWYWAYEIPKPVKGPLTITVPGIRIATEEFVQIPQDVGQDPRPGQTWGLDASVKLGGHIFFLEDVTAVENGYTVRYLSEILKTSDAAFGFEIIGTTITSSSSVESGHPKGRMFEYSETFLYPNARPKGELIFRLWLSQTMEIPGPWKLTWDPFHSESSRSLFK
jgi:hypothetical protein